MAKKNFLNIVKGAFLTEVPDETKAEEVVQPVTVQQVVPQTVVQSQPTVSVQPSIATTNLIQPVQGNGQVVGQVDANILENLCTVLDEKNLPGPDYLELKSAANDAVMQKAIPDETARFTCAYISMKVNAPHLNKEVIINSIDKYIEYLESERQSGLNELAIKWKEEVDDKEALVDTAQKEVQELQEALNAKIMFISETTAEITTSKNQCTVSKANFSATVDYVINNLNTDKTKLNEILKD